MRFCSEDGCPDVALSGSFCEKHADPLNRKVQNAPRHERDAWYKRAAWCGKYGVRLFKLQRTPLCEICGNKATQVHHLREEWKEKGDWFLFMGGYDMEFLQSLCGRCHARISMKNLMYGTEKENGQQHSS